jgi:hypothetical protein
MTTKVKATKSGAVAVHESSSCEHGETHGVILFDLRVMITKEEGYWFAQCMEIDYAVDGESRKDVMDRFTNGLAQTIDLHLAEFGSLDKLLEPAPSRVLMEFNTKFTRLYSQVTEHFHEHSANIRYFEAQEAA